MIDTDKYENMRLLFLDFIADPMCEEDEAAWKRHLNTYDELLAEVKRLRGILGDIVEIEEWGGDGKDIDIAIKYGDGYVFRGWLDKVHGGDDE